MTDLVAWAQENVAEAVAAAGGTLAVAVKVGQWAGRFGQFLWALYKAHAEKRAKAAQEAAAAAAAAKSAAAAAEVEWRAAVVNGLNAARAGVEAMERRMDLFAQQVSEFSIQLRDHDTRTRNTALVVARVEGLLDRLDHVEDRARDATAMAAEASRAVARLHAVPTTDPSVAAPFDKPQSRG